MEKEILNLLKKIIKEDEDTFIDITDMDDDSAAETVISKKDIFKKLRDKMSDKDRTPAGFEYGEIVSGEMGEEIQEFFYFDDEDTEELSQKEPTYVGKGLADNKIKNKIESKFYGSFDDEHGWFDEHDRQHKGDFDYDYDEEEFSDYESLMNKHGKNQRWFGPKDGKMFFDKYQEKFGGKPFRVRTRKSEMGENEMEEGNAFSGALAKAKEDGKSSFEVDGKTYQVKEAKEEKFIQKATKKIEKKGTSGKFGVWCKSHGLDKDGEVTKKCIDKAMKSDDSKVVKMANFAKNIGGFKGAKHESVREKVVFTESELINFIERLVEAEKVVDKGFKTAMTATKKENTDAIKQVASKMKDYMKNMGTEYEENPKSFPKGNKIMSREDFGKEVSDDKKKAYTASDAVEEYIDAFAYPGQTNLRFDEIKPDDTKIEKYLKGHSTTGNAQVDEEGNGLGNVVPSEVGEKFYKNYEENLYGAEQADASYKRQSQPVEVAGEEKSEGNLKSLKSAKKSQQIFDKLEESVENKKVITEMEKMKNLIGYNRKTQ